MFRAKPPGAIADRVESQNAESCDHEELRLIFDIGLSIYCVIACLKLHLTSTQNNMGHQDALVCSYQSLGDGRCISASCPYVGTIYQRPYEGPDSCLYPEIPYPLDKKCADLCSRDQLCKAYSNSKSYSGSTTHDVCLFYYVDTPEQADGEKWGLGTDSQCMVKSSCYEMTGQPTNQPTPAPVPTSAPGPTPTRTILMKFSLVPLLSIALVVYGVYRCQKYASGAKGASPDGTIVDAAAPSASTCTPGVMGAADPPVQVSGGGIVDYRSSSGGLSTLFGTISPFKNTRSG